MHAAQAFSIPFENLDIHLGRAISLKPEDLAAKLIYRHRGGYCFELNGIFGLALKTMGFAVRPLLGRGIYGRPGPGARTHQVLIVTISGRNWLADNGFGGPGLRSPLLLVKDRIEEQFGERYRLRQDPEFGMALQKESKGTFIDLYSFDEKEVTLDADIEMANHFQSTSPDSIFRVRRICVFPHPWGRVTLNDMELSIHRDGQVTSQTLMPGPSYLDAIARHFGINLNAAYEDFLPLGQL